MNEWDEFTPARSDAIRAELVRFVTSHSGRVQRRFALGIGLVLAGAVAGAGGAAATAQIWNPQPFVPQAVPVVEPTSNPGVPAPPGHLPGQPIVSLLGQVGSYDVDGAERIIQLDPPDGATHVRVSLTCTTPGTTGWGFDVGGNNPTSSCSGADIASSSASGWMDFDLRDNTMYPQQDLFYVQPVAGAASIVTLQYLALIETAWIVNAAGETCGVGKPGLGEPDLVAVIAVTPTGEHVEGYARRTQLEYPFPGEHMPTSPAEALEQQEQNAQVHPNGVDIPAFECDGVTQVGVFRVG
jgi:hypothetical protein